MDRFMVLIKGELLRLRRYNLFAASIFVAILWVGTLHFINIEDVTTVIPQLVFIDVTTMAMLLIGVTSIYEREEGTVKTLLVSPISKSEYILAKIFANIVPSIISLTFMYVYAKIFKIVEINYILLLGAVLIVAIFHSIIGMLLTYYSKDFTDMVMSIMKIFFIFLFPVILEEFNIVTNEIFRKLVYLLPTKSALMIIMGTTGIIEFKKIFISIIYIGITSGALYYMVWKKFDIYGLRERGE